MHIHEWNLVCLSIITRRTKKNHHTKLSLKQEIVHFNYSGPSRSRPARSLLFFKWRLFHPKWLHFSLSEHTPKLTKLGISSHLPKNFIIYCCPWFPPLGGAIIKESGFWLKTHIYFVAHSKTFYPHIHWTVLKCKLLNNNFLYILLKTWNVAYLHIGVSECHETQVNTSPLGAMKNRST